MIMPRNPSMKLLCDYSPESIDPEVEEVPAKVKDALISVSVKIIGLSRDIWIPKIFGPPGPNITEIC